MRLKIMILKQHTGSHQLTMKYLHKVQDTLRCPVTDVIKSVWRDRKTILTRASCRSTPHDKDQPFDNFLFCGATQERGDGYGCAYYTGEKAADLTIKALKEGK